MCGNRCDNDNMQGPVIPECAEAKGLKGGQEMDKNGTSHIAFLGDYVVGKTVLLRAAANKAAVNTNHWFIDELPVREEEDRGVIFQLENWKMKPDFAEGKMMMMMERDAFTEGIDTFNVPNVMKEVDFQQLVENTGLKMNHDIESSSPSTLQSITKGTFYQFMISLLLCYQVLGCWMTENVMIVTQALQDFENNGVITQFPLLFLFSEVILESRIQLKTENPDMMQCWKHGAYRITSNQKTLNMGHFKFRGWNEESQRVCSRVTRQYLLLLLLFNEAIRLSEIQVSPIYVKTFSFEKK